MVSNVSCGKAKHLRAIYQTKNPSSLLKSLINLQFPLPTRPKMELPREIQQPFLTAASTPNLEEALETVITTSRTFQGRSTLTTRNLLPATLDLIQSFSPTNPTLSLLSLKLLRNLCAGDPTNQDKFIQLNGVGIVADVIISSSEIDQIGIVRTGLQVLANASQGGAQHMRTIWEELFPDFFLRVSRVRRREICDPLCMILYSCCEGVPGLVDQLFRDCGLRVLSDILRIGSLVGFEEDWLKLLISWICLEEGQFLRLFSCLYSGNCDSEDGGCDGLRKDQFSSEQAFLLRVVSEIVNERIMEIVVPKDFALCVLGILERSVGVVDFSSAGKKCLPTGSAAIDVLGYSLAILRDVCAQDGQEVLAGEGDGVRVVDAPLSARLLELLLTLLRDLGLPTTIKKAMGQSEDQGGSGVSFSKHCPYKGFQRDVVAVIGNCAYRRKHVQDEIREKNGILLLLQQCVSDEENPYLREWGIWSVRNILEGNAENQRLVTELELQKSLNLPELSGLGLKVEVDQLTRRAKLVNVSASGT